MTIALAQKTPITNATISGSVPWEVYCTIDSSFSRIDFSIDNGPVIWKDSYGPFVFKGDSDGGLDTTKLSNGPHVLVTRAYDKYGALRSTLKTPVTVGNLVPWAGKAGVAIPGTAQIDTPDESAAYFGALTDLGIQAVKIRYTGNTAVEDQAVTDALAVGLKVRIVVVTGSLSDSAYAARCTDAATRYGAMGVTDYELGSDINVTASYLAPSSYFTKAKAGYDAIKAVNSEYRVAGGALKTYGTYGSFTSTSMNPIQYLDAVYAAAAGRKWSDEIVYNPIVYGNDVTAEWVMAQISGWGQIEGSSPSLRSVMTKYGYDGQKITIGSMGVPTDAGSYTSGMSPDEQARLFPIALDKFKAKWWAGDFFIYTLLDPGTTTSPEDHFGLFLPDFTAKDAVATLADYLGGTPPPTPAPPPPGVAPENTSKPYISGTPAVVGKQLIGNVGNWNGDPTFSVKWKRGSTELGNTAYYTPVDADVGTDTLTFEVSATNSYGGPIVATSDPVSVGAAPFVESPDNTVVLAGSTDAIIAADGHRWMITSDGKVAVDGTPDPITQQVVELAYEGGKVWQKNSFNKWWYKVHPSDTWLPSGGTSTSPIPGSPLPPPPVFGSRFWGTTQSVRLSTSGFSSLLAARTREFTDALAVNMNILRLDASYTNGDLAKSLGFKQWAVIFGSFRSYPDTTSLANQAIAYAKRYPNVTIYAEWGNELNFSQMTVKQVAQLHIDMWGKVLAAGLTNLKISLSSVGNGPSSVEKLLPRDWCYQLAYYGCKYLRGFHVANYHAYDMSPTNYDKWMGIITPDSNGRSCQAAFGYPPWYLSEFGEALSSAPGSTTDEKEANQALAVGRWMDWAAADPHCIGGMVYNLSDDSPGSGTGYGLRRLDLSHRPSWGTFHDKAAVLT